MATLVLGAVGAVVGSAIPGVGTAWGWSIGTTIGSFIDRANMPNQEVGRLTDRRFSGSQYGASIPRVWGTARVGGNVIWADEDEDGNHLVEHRESSGGKGGGGGVTSFWYSSTFAVAFCVGEHTFPDGTSVNRNVSLKKLWGNDVTVWDDGWSGYVHMGDEMEWFDGAEDQEPSGVIMARDGTSAEDTVANRGLAFLTIEDLDLRDFGMGLPNWNARVQTDPVTLADVISDLLRYAGLTLDQIDVAEATDSITGLVVSEIGDSASVIETLLEFYGYDLVEVDDKLKVVKRGGSIVATIPWEELGAGIDEAGPRIRLYREQESEMPGRVELQYYDLATDLQAASQSEVNPVGESLNDRTLQVPLTLTSTEAKKKVQQEVDASFEARMSAEVSVSPRWKWLSPADPLSIEVRPGVFRRFRVTEMRTSHFGPIGLTLVRERAAQFDQDGAGGDSGDSGLPPSGGATPSVFTAWSEKEILDAHQTAPGFYVVANGDEAWRGGRILYSHDGATWLSGPYVSGRSTFGETTNALSDSGASAGSYDDANDLDVDVTASGGEIVSVSDDANDAGVNWAVVGSEILAVGTASPDSPGIYTLSHLKRGLRSTVMSGHASGERFVVVSSATRRVPVPEDWVGDTVQVKVVSPGQSPIDVTAVVVTITPRTPTLSEEVAATALAYVPVTPTLVDSATSGPRTPVSWTTFDASAVLPAGTKFVELQAVANDGGDDITPPTRQAIEARKDSGSAVYTVGEGTIINDDGDIDICSSIRVAVTDNLEFDYRVVEGFEDGWALTIVGAWRSLV